MASTPAGKAKSADEAPLSQSDLAARLHALGPHVLARYPGPLAHADTEGTVEALNEPGIALAEALNDRLRPQLESLLAHAGEAGAAQSEMLRIGDDRVAAAISVFVLPLTEPNGDGRPTGYFVLGRDATFDRNLRDALVERGVPQARVHLECYFNSPQKKSV